MSQLHAEVGIAQLSKDGEELCGDKVVLAQTPKGNIIVLSDGLGSGVKANILATLTTKIASSMLQRGIPLVDVVSTIADTLPVCQQRKIAYSTLHIIKISPEGLATIVEFDCPNSFLLRDGKVIPFPVEKKNISGKIVGVGVRQLQENDIIVAVSDGVIHAGIGGLLKLGWGWNGIAEQLRQICTQESNANYVSEQIINCCQGYYLGLPGDDSTVVTVKVRKARRLTLLTGPPVNPVDDCEVVKRFMRQSGKKVVSGGTTANIVSREINKSLVVDLSCYDEKIPPIAHIKGIDLVTEGILTLNAALERINNSRMIYASKQADGATLLTRMLLESDYIEIFAGKAINPAHQNPKFPFEINIKSQVLSKLQAELQAKGKHVNIEWF